MGSWTWQVPLVNSGVFVKVTQFPASRSVPAWTAKVTGVEAHLKERILVLARLICSAGRMTKDSSGLNSLWHTSRSMGLTLPALPEVLYCQKH
jgi:hypothetical protein